MNLDNVLLAIDVLQDVPTRKFSMQTWGDFKHTHDIGERLNLHDRCGTAGCALGWLASDPRAIRRGLYMVSGYFGFATVRYREFEDEYAGAKFLGVDSLVGEVLFLPSEYKRDEPEDRTRGEVRPRNVIERLNLLAHLGEDRFLDAMGYGDTW
jgi:hypothetical protein